jgi:hypothetical protein
MLSEAVREACTSVLQKAVDEATLAGDTDFTWAERCSHAAKRAAWTLRMWAASSDGVYPPCTWCGTPPEGVCRDHRSEWGWARKYGAVCDDCEDFRPVTSCRLCAERPEEGPASGPHPLELTLEFATWSAAEAADGGAYSAGRSACG